MKAKRLKQDDIRRLARRYTKWWIFRPFAVRRKMVAVERLAVAMANKPHGMRTRMEKAIARDASK